MKRKVLSVILSLAFCVSLAVPAWAIIAISDYNDATAQDEFSIEYLGDGSVNLVGEDFLVHIDSVEEVTRAIILGAERSIFRIPRGATITYTFDSKYIGTAYYDDGMDYYLDEDGAYQMEVGWAGELIAEYDGKPIVYAINYGIDGRLYEGSGNPKGILFYYMVIPESPSSWAVEQVNAAIGAGFVPTKLQYNYTEAITRAEFCALAVALYENVKGEITGRTTFYDTIDVNVQKAASIGVVNGVGDNKFAPNDKLTREQAATMLSRLADAIGKPLTAKTPTFADNGSISSWAVEGVGQVQAAGIMSGVGNNTFSPKADYTREQSIITITRLYNVVK